MRDFKHIISNDHEQYIANIFKGRRSKSSGNQFNDQADGRMSRFANPYAFAWDGKATTKNSISITLNMWTKICEQAHYEYPMLALRFVQEQSPPGSYGVVQDLVAIEADLFAEILARVNTLEYENKLLLDRLDDYIDVSDHSGI